MMGRPTRRRETIKSEVRDAIVRAFAAGGCLLGILWMVNTWDSSPPDCETKKQGAGLVSECAKQAFTDSLYPGLAKIGVGIFGGAVVAILICLTVPGLKRKPL